MMQMLVAGGMTLLSDFERQADADNPRGYCEWEPAKLLPKEPHRIDEAEGKVVKVISQLLMSVPEGRQYKVIFMQRPLPEVLASQEEMLKRRGKSDFASQEAMSVAFEKHLKEVNSWFLKRPDIKIIRLPYARVLEEPRVVSQELKTFLGIDLNVEAMAQQVDLSLYRNRRS